MNQIRDMMSEKLVTLNEYVGVSDALLRLRNEKVHHALVVELGELKGVICCCDLEAAPHDAAVGACMKRHYVFIDDESSPIDAARLMQRWGIGLLPVIAGEGHVVGVVTRRDLRNRGFLPGRPGVDRCAACGKTHSLSPWRDDTTPVFCRDCLQPSTSPADLNITLEGGG
jgi:CBS-domain-containing membrane protein